VAAQLSCAIRMVGSLIEQRAERERTSGVAAGGTVPD
jgi:hypothetical protein